jgi:hypothetical protein
MFTLSHRVLLSGAATLLMATQAQASAISASGAFIRDDQVQLVSFRTGATGLVRIETFGYAGGIDANGVAVAAGGFDPVFAVFRADGTLLSYGDDGATRVDPTTGGAFDALLDIVLSAGDYFIAISQFDNFAIGPNFSAGFLESGNTTFTAPYGCSAGRFCDITGGNRTGTFDISVSGATVPEPTTLALVGLVLPGIWIGLRRKR